MVLIRGTAASPACLLWRNSANANSNRKMISLTGGAGGKNDRRSHGAREAAGDDGEKSMALKDLGDTWYVVRAHNMVSHRMRGSSTADLEKAVEVLCSTLQQLEKDSVFWSALGDLSPVLSEREYQLDSVIGSLELFLEQEFEVLSRHLSAGDARAMVSDVSAALYALRDKGNGYTVEGLRSGVTALSEETCRLREPAQQVAATATPSSNLLLKVVVGVARGAVFLAGGSLVVMNGFALVSGSLDAEVAALSADAGMRVMASQLPLP